MFTRPADLPDSRVAEALESAWSLVVDSIAYAAVGFGSHHWRVTSGGRRWFVTVDDLAMRQHVDEGLNAARRLTAALATVRLLRDLGMTFAVAPVATAMGDLLVPIDDRYVAALYPFIDGEAHGWGPFGDRDERLAMLDRLVVLHTAPTRARRHALVDDYVVPCRGTLMAALADRSQTWHSGPFAEPTRRLLDQRADYIVEQFERYDCLVDDVTPRSDRMVVTHGEPHRANTISTDAGVMLVDWDTLLIAPPERDLWWLANEDVAILDEYHHRTGTAVDTQALHLYRLRWKLSDLAIFATQFRDLHDESDDTRTAWDGLVNTLRPEP